MPKSDTTQARAANMLKAARRRAADPAELAKAVRTIDAGIADGRLTPEAYIRKLVDSAPPLTDEQRARLAGLLLPSTSTTRQAGEAA